MVKISNRTILSFTIIFLLVLIITASISKITEMHEERAKHALESKVEYYARRCYLEKVCMNDITIQYLYDKEYIDSKLVDPVSKEVIDPLIAISYDAENDKITIYW